jgi:hypothetical protein
MLRRWVLGGILRISFGKSPSIGVTDGREAPEMLCQGGLSGFGDLRRVRSNTSLERTRDE